jgi:hypothetical protein
MNNVMIDIETLGNEDKYNIPIISVAAVKFDAEGNISKDKFYEVVDIKDALHTAHIEDHKLEFWLNKDNRHMFFDLMYHKDKKPLATVLTGLIDYMRTVDSIRDAKFWSQGINFDHVILEGQCKKLGLKLPGHYYQWMDSRTYVKTNAKLLGFNDVKDFASYIGTNSSSHNALSDVIYQVQTVVFVLQNLRDNLKTKMTINPYLVREQEDSSLTPVVPNNEDVPPIV